MIASVDDVKNGDLVEITHAPGEDEDTGWWVPSMNQAVGRRAEVLKYDDDTFTSGVRLSQPGAPWHGYVFPIKVLRKVEPEPEQGPEPAPIPAKDEEAVPDLLDAGYNAIAQVIRTAKMQGVAVSINISYDPTE